MDCPHLTHQVQYTLDPQEHRKDPVYCPECRLSIRRCPDCGEANRRPARYCRHCGIRLDPLEDEDLKLLPPGEIAKSTQGPPHYPLEQVLGLGEEGRADLWFGHPDGLFVATSVPAQEKSPISLFFMPQFLFKGNDIRLLTAHLPTFDEWIDQPLVVDPGIFVLTGKALHYFPAHGFPELFPHRRWESAPNERLLAVTHEPATEDILLLSIDQGGLWVARGNVQSEQWSSRVRLDLPNLKPSYQIGIVPGEDHRLWVYDGETLVIANLSDNARTALTQSRYTLTRGTKPPETAAGRGRSGYFRPLMLRTSTGALSLVYPMRADSADVVPAIISLLNADAVGVRINTAKGSWVVPDVRAEGFFCGNTDGFGRFQSQPTAQWSDATSLAERSLAIGRRWLAGIAERREAGPLTTGPAQPYLATYRIERAGGACTIDAYRQAPLPTKGEIPRGMPPLQRGDCIYVPIRQGTRAHVRTTVYQIRILAE